MVVINCLWKAVKFMFYTYVLGGLALIIILFCYSYLNDIQYTNGFWQYIKELLSSSQDATEIVWGVILNFPFGEILNELFEVVSLGDVFDLSKVISNTGQVLKESYKNSEIFVGLVQLSLAQYLRYIFSRANTFIKKIWKDKMFEYADWYVSIFWTIVSFTVSATILKFAYIVIRPEHLKIVFLIIMFRCYFLHALLLSKNGFSIPICLVYLALDMIFFFIQSVLVWFLGIFIINPSIGVLPCVIVYFLFIILKEKIINKLLLLCV